MTVKIISLLQDSITPFITKFDLQYDKELVDKIIPAPNEK
jgi:hypothetical protein